MMDNLWLLGIIVALFVAFIITVMAFTFAKTYLKAYFSGARVPLLELVGMRFRNVRSSLIVDARISMVQSGIDTLTTRDLESVYLVRRNAQDLMTVVTALKLRSDVSTQPAQSTSVA